MVSGGWRELSAVRGSAVTVSALVHFSDSGTPLDPGVRSVLEGLFAVDLSGIRLHVGPRTDALLRARGYPAATSGYRVLMPARRRGGSERWLRILAHEIVHAIQQAQGIAQAGGFWERHAEAAAMAVTSGRAYPDQGLAPPGRDTAPLSWPASTRGNTVCWAMCLALTWSALRPGWQAGRTSLRSRSGSCACGKTVAQGSPGSPSAPSRLVSGWLPCPAADVWPPTARSMLWRTTRPAPKP